MRPRAVTRVAEVTGVDLVLHCNTRSVIAYQQKCLSIASYCKGL